MEAKQEVSASRSVELVIIGAATMAASLSRATVIACSKVTPVAA